VHEGARVETVFRAEHSLERVAIANLDGSLEDDMQLVRWMPLPDDYFIWTEIADIERRPEFFNLLMGETVERRVGGFESRHNLTRLGQRALRRGAEIT
jgi:hypothetical protein